MITRRRCLLVWTVLTLASAGTARWAWAAVGPTERVDQAISSLAGLALAACATWAWTVGTVVVVQALRRPDRPPTTTRGVPQWLSRAVLAACGLAVVAVVPAQAEYAAPPDPQVLRTTADLDGLPFPDRAVGPAAPTSARAATAPAPAEVGSVVVRPGESLWRIAADLLGPDATDAEVAAATRDLHTLNRAEVGPDPDLIHPGLHLRTPRS